MAACSTGLAGTLAAAVCGRGVRDGRPDGTWPEQWQRVFSVPGTHPSYLVRSGAGPCTGCWPGTQAGRWVLLNETVPAWVVDIVVEKKLPKFIKVTFSSCPTPTLGIRPQEGEADSQRLPADPQGDRARLREGDERERGGERCWDTPQGAGRAPGEGEEGSSVGRGAGRAPCNDSVLDPNSDLRTVKHFIWKSGSDLVLHIGLR